MKFDSLDDYLLDKRGSKADVIAGLLDERADDPQAAPFYRALEMLGAKIDDQALIALRLVLAGKSPEDDAVRRLRSNVAASREGGDRAAEARRAYEQQLA
ncbi:MAG: hypothetical protein GIW97_07140 [Candidatus Eremiobacteraeota bacterium]|nr:hypothetical protein [Candidatus Eremiobacteraeota bacterium]